MKATVFDGSDVRVKGMAEHILPLFSMVTGTGRSLRGRVHCRATWLSNSYHGGVPARCVIDGSESSYIWVDAHTRLPPVSVSGRIFLTSGCRLI